MRLAPPVIDSRKKVSPLSLISHQPEFRYTKVYSGIAKKIGITQAYLIQMVESWCQSNQRNNKRGYFHNNEWWTCGNYEEWEERCPELGSSRTIQRLFLKLERDGYIIADQLNKASRDRRKFYRVNSEKVRNLLYKDFSVVSNRGIENDTISAELLNVPNSDAADLNVPNMDLNVPNLDVTVPNMDAAQPETYALQGSQTPNYIRTIKLDNQITGEGEKEEQEVTSYQDPEIKSSASRRDKVEHVNAIESRDKVEPINSVCSVNKNQDLATTSTSTHEGDNSGAAREIGEVFTDNTEVAQNTVVCTENIEVVKNTSVESQQNNNISSENDSQTLSFSDDPLQEPLFLKYYKSMKSRIDIKNAESYIKTLLADADNGKPKVMTAFQEWKKDCLAQGRKISDVSEAEASREKENINFSTWSEAAHCRRLTFLVELGYKKFLEDPENALWYEWAIARNPIAFTERPIPA